MLDKESLCLHYTEPLHWDTPRALSVNINHDDDNEGFYDFFQIAVELQRESLTYQDIKIVKNRHGM